MKQNITCAFLGPEGTFSNVALQRFIKEFPALESAEQKPLVNLADIFQALDRGVADFGVVPIENSLEGPVSATLDAFAFSSRAEILGETILDIHQALVIAKDAKISDIKTIATHPQAYGQCRRWLNKNLPECNFKPLNSTAAGAKSAAKDKTLAAICSPLAAQLADASVYAEAIEDNLSSQTRFVLIGDRAFAENANIISNSAANDPSLSGKTTLALFINSDRPGTLNMILSELAYANINMTMIQSRPTKRELGDYMFFIDIDGYANEPDITTALNCLRLKLRELKIIGSYPKAKV